MPNYTQPDYVEKRIRYFNGQLLTDQDFIDEQRYHIDRQRRVNRFFSPGIVEGLAVHSETESVVVEPGTALDGKGRLIVLGQPQEIVLDDFDGQAAYLVVSYQEESSDRAADEPKDDTRFHEKPRFDMVGSENDVPGNAIVLARYTVQPSGGVTIDNTVRRYAGLRLPDEQPDETQWPTLRAGSSGKVELSKDVNVTGAVKATSFIGDGSQLGGISSAEEWNQARDAIARLEEMIDQSGAAGSIGDPPVGEDYATAFFDHWTSDDTSVGSALFEISQAFGELAPARAGVLMDQELVFSGAGFFDAKLPKGLSVAWQPYTPGETVSNLVVDGAYTLTTPDFRAGKARDNPGSAGQVAHVLNGVDSDVHNLQSSGRGRTGAIEVTDLVEYETFWLKANARIDFVQTTEGRTTHAIRGFGAAGGDAGISKTTTILFDDTNPVPSFSTGLSHKVLTEKLNYLSGVAYYKTGTVFECAFIAAAGIFEKAYHATHVAKLEVPGALEKAINPAAVPSVADTFSVSGEPGQITLSIDGVSSDAPDLTARLFKPKSAPVSDTEKLARGINTYGVVSTTTRDVFQDEHKRLVLGNGTSWESTATLEDGNLQVKNGRLIHGNDGDYKDRGFTGEQAYQRRIAKVAASGGTLDHEGVTVSPFGTGDVNLLLLLEADGKWFDLGLSLGLAHGAGDGSSPDNSIGAKISGGTDRTVFSFGTFSTGNNGNAYRVRIVYRATGQAMTRIEGS